MNNEMNYNHELRHRHCLVLCYNWQGPIQGSTPMPQWPNGGGGFRVGGGVHDKLHIPVRTGGIFYFPWQWHRHQIEQTDGV